MPEYKTPGVYIQETDAFPPSIVGVETGVPCFIGYTEKASEEDGRDLRLIPRRVQSFTEFIQLFGTGRTPSFYLTSEAVPTGDHDWGPVQLGYSGARLAEIAGTRFNLYDGIRLFYANGGGACYVVSCGLYGDAWPPPPIEASALKAGLDASAAVVGPTMTVIPDLVLLPDPADCATLAVEMLVACQQAGDRMALLDVWGVDLDRKRDWSATIAAFRAGLAAAPAEARRYGVAYFPPLATSLITTNDVGFDAFSTAPPHLATLQQALRASLAAAFPAGGGLDPRRQAIETNWIDRLGVLTPGEATECVRTLSAELPGFTDLRETIAAARGGQPPSGAMAGVWARNDADKGVWRSPANVGIAAVLAPALPISDAQHADLNVSLSGLSVNAIRSFVGHGTLVWGARTLDGNSSDWRYIAVRRTVLYVEQSVRGALQSMVFQPNEPQTWVAISAMIENFLHGLWAAGGLVGAKHADAYAVRCGMGVTMTADDMLNGILRVELMLAIMRPAEFIVLSVQQQQAAAG